MIDKSHFVASINFSNAIPKRVLLIASAISTFGAIDQICWNRFERGNVPTDASLIHANNSFSYIFKLTWLLLRGRYSAYLFDDIRLLPMMVIIGKLRAAKLIYNRQEVPTISAARLVTRYIKLPFTWSLALVEAVETIFGCRVDVVICIPLSSAGEKRLTKWGRPLVMLNNVPEKSNDFVLRGAESRPRGWLPTLVYSGAVAPENGLLSYLHLIRRMNANNNGLPVKLQLVGRLWKLSSDDLHDLIRRESVEDFVEYREWMPYDELMRLLSLADIGLALADPSYEKYTHMGDGASRKVFTYMAAGLPIIAGGAFGKVVSEEAVGYFVKYGDVDSMYEAAQFIISNPNAAREMGERAQAAIINRYNWEIEQHTLIKLLREII